MSDILIVGGGLAGSAAAIALAQSGRAVTLIEKESGPRHKICGEFLSIEAQAYLQQLGLARGLLAGHPINRLRLIRGERVVESHLPFTGMGLTRKYLDEVLLQQAASAGVKIHRGEAAKISEESGHLCVSTATLGTMIPNHLLLCSGKTDLKPLPRAARPGNFVGFKTYFRLSPVQSAALAHHIELIIFPGGYAGLQLVEDGSANLCLLIKGKKLRALGGTWATTLEHIQSNCAHLATRLAGAEDLLSTPLAIARVPYGFVHRATSGDPANLFRLGDQAAVIPSFTGDGMAIALHSAARAVQALQLGQTASHYHESLRRDVSRQIRLASLLQKLMHAPGALNVIGFLPQILGKAAAFTRVPENSRLSAI